MAAHSAVFPAPASSSEDFVSYQLASTPQPQAARPLAAAFRPAALASDAAHFGYREARARSGDARLVPALGNDAGWAAYAGAQQGSVWAVQAGQTSGAEPMLLGRLAPPARREQGHTTLLSTGSASWLACSGSTSISLLHLPTAGIPTRSWRVSLPASSDEESTGPLAIVAQAPLDGSSHIQVLARRARRVPASGALRARTVFDVLLLRLPMDGNTPKYNVEVVPAWTVQAEEPPYWVHLDPRGQRHLLLAESGVTLPQPSEATPTAGSSASALPAAPAERPREFEAPSRRRPPPYVWAQTSDTLTMAFTLPSELALKAVRVHFSRRGLSATLSPSALPGEARIQELPDGQDPGPSEELSHAQSTVNALQGGKYMNRRLWGDIDVNGSVWTFERVASSSGETGLLSIHLEKAHAGTRWPQIFGVKPAPVSIADGPPDAERMDAEEDEDEEVPETMDPTQLLAQLEGLEKYTEPSKEADALSATWGGVPASAPLGTERTSLLQDGLEDEDADVGRPARLTAVIEQDGKVTLKEQISNADDRVLAVALPSALPSEALVVRAELDGNVFDPPAGSSSAWKPSLAFPALAFVLASKRDAHRVFLALSPRRDVGHVLAFEGAPNVGSGGPPPGAGNLFVYATPATPSAPHAQSKVVRLGSDSATGGSGALVGVAAVACGERRTLMCLCEHQLLLLDDLL